MYSYKLHITLFIVSAVAHGNIPMFDEDKLLHNFEPHIPTFKEIAEKIGLPCEEYNITTSDGYIIGIFRIPGEVKKPVLLMHGLLDCADDYILREEGSIAVILAREGYDVWVGNHRGNRYSRNHVTLNPDKDVSFWNYSQHEMGTIDLPEIIDFVLEKTGQSQLSAVGHSEGTTIFFVLGSKRPEYNKKIKVLAALAPIAYLHHMRGGLALLLKIEPELNAIGRGINYQELLGHDSDLTVLIRKICAIPDIGYAICSFIGSLVLGFDYAQIEPEFLMKIINHLPAGTSRKNIVHLGQAGLRKEFAEFDYGADKNLEMYSSVNPPLYNLSKVTFDVAMICGANDPLSTPEDVDILESQLPNVVKRVVLDYPLWTHMDYLYGKFIPQYLRSLLLEILAKYN